MRIRYMSDLHLEFHGRDGPEQFSVPSLPEDKDTVLILAGDIDVDKHAPRLALRTAGQFRAIIQTAGNHEYYKAGSPQRLPIKLQEALADLDNVHFLENGAVDIDGVRFIGATLWTDFNDGDKQAMSEARKSMNDFRCIRTGSTLAPYKKKFSPSDALNLHVRSRDYIFAQVLDAKNDGLLPVVVTHHAPRHPEGPNGSPLSFSYGSDLAEHIRSSPPLLWIHGHLHETFDYHISNTRVVCNPRGYLPDYPNTAFDLLAHIDLDE